MKSTIIRFFYFFLGLAIMNFGNYLTILARKLGVSPWDVFHLGLSRYLPFIKLGTLTQLVGVSIILLSMLLGIRPRIGTWLNMYLGGVFLNFWLDHHFVKVPVNVWQAAIYMAFGLIFLGFGCAMYISADLGAGPRDSLMLGLHNKTHRSISLVRTVMEVLAVVVGIGLGGPFGIGTIIYSFGIGPCVQISLKVFAFKQTKILPES